MWIYTSTPLNTIHRSNFQLVPGLRIRGVTPLLLPTSLERRT
jgi:hypothetical protein